MTGGPETIKNCAVVILAAGRSNRLGRQKQLLRYQNKTLLQHAIDTAKQSVQSVIVVLGNNADNILKETVISGTQVVINNNWQSGIASAIRCGIQSVQTLDFVADAAILMVCDQP